MANVDHRFGLRPVKHLSGAPWNGQVMKCYISSGESNNLFRGDAVVLTGSASTDGKYPTIGKATAGNTNSIAGVIYSFEYVSPGDMTNLNLQRNYRPASTAMYAYVCFDPTVIYEIQGDSVTTIGYADVGSCFDLIYTHSGDTSTGESGMELNSSAKTASASTYQVRLWGLADVPGNSQDYANAIWLVSINLNQIFSAGVNTAGTAIAGGVGV